MRAVAKRSKCAGRVQSRMAEISKRTNSMTAVRNAINIARYVDDSFERYGIPRQLLGTGFSSVRLSEHRGLSRGSVLVDWMLSCAKELQDSYEQSRMSWNEAEKLREICHPQQRVIIAYLSETDPIFETSARADVHVANKAEADGQNVEHCKKDPIHGNRLGFLSFRWVVDEKRPVMYVYELYVVPYARKHGLATALMRIGEQICTAARIPWTVLTVFDANVPALALYLKLRYGTLTFLSGSSNSLCLNEFNSDKSHLLVTN